MLYWTLSRLACMPPRRITLSRRLDIQFAGQTAHYQHLIFQQVVQGNEHRITGTIPSPLSDFKIPPPSFFTVPLKNEMPVKVDMMWHPL
jgi:hypothetical protein